MIKPKRYRRETLVDLKLHALELYRILNGTSHIQMESIEIANQVGCSQSHINQIIKIGLSDIKEKIDKSWID